MRTGRATLRPRAIRRPSVRASSAPSRAVSPGRASSGYRPSAGGGSGTRATTSPLAFSGQKKINRPKTGGPGRGLSLSPRADFPTKI